jgi:hypothetical protein
MQRVAMSATKYSGRLRNRIATASPRLTPSAYSVPAARRTRAAYWPHVHSIPSPESRSAPWSR